MAGAHLIDDFIGCVLYRHSLGKPACLYQLIHLQEQLRHNSIGSSNASIGSITFVYFIYSMSCSLSVSMVALSSMEKQDVFDGYTKVVISVSDDVEYSAGDDTGRTMTLVCPWGTQAMAEKLLSRVRSPN